MYIAVVYVVAEHCVAVAVVVLVERKGLTTVISLFPEQMTLTVIQPTSTCYVALI